MVYQFKVQLKNISKPPVWRKIIIPADFTFQRFHDVIQTVFGWEDYHLFEFQDKEYQCTIRIAVPFEDDFDFDVNTLDASKVRLSDLFIGNFRKLLYVYDFGDNWVHEITLEKIFDDKRKEAFCLSGKGNCPPEDCGGIWGYENLLELHARRAARKRISADDRERLEWYGMDLDFDPEWLSLEECREIVEDFNHS